MLLNRLDPRIPSSIKAVFPIHRADFQAVFDVLPGNFPYHGNEGSRAVST